MEIEVLYYGEIWFWLWGEERLIGREHLRNSSLLIRRDNITRKVNFREIKKPPVKK